MRLNTGAYSFDANFSILAGTRFGPDAFAGFRLLSSFSMPGAVNSMSGIGETGSPSMSGRCPSGSLVNCEVYCESCQSMSELTQSIYWAYVILQK